MELGIYSFGDATADSTGAHVSHGERLRRLVEEVELADQVGLDVYGIGEHHRADYSVSAPAIVLAAAAERTSRIRLTSAVTVLSSDDPVRVFQQFSTLDLLSGGRAEIMAGRGSFIESFPLFGYDLDDYDDLYAEKLAMLLELTRGGERLNWPGTPHTAAVDDRPVYPQPQQAELPVWLAIGGTPASAVRAGTLGLPLALAIIGGEPARFAPFVELYREAAREAGHDPATLGVAISSHGFIADTRERALEIAWPPYRLMFSRIAAERGFTPPNRAMFEAGAAAGGHLLLGDPEAVAEKILAEHEVFDNTRTLVQFSTASTPHADVLRSIELFGTEVAPIVREEVARRRA
ncbi:MAG: luciferase [Thermoleophilia bacterium]|nr:luciferase [Thermoleophilia bacterium]